MNNVIVEQTAVRTKNLQSSIKEAINSKKTSGITKLGIQFKKIANTLILF